MKPHVDFFIPSYENEEEGMVMHFTSVSQIDDVIESLNEARIELARQIEAKRVNNRERRRRKKERLALDKFNVREFICKDPDEVKRTGDVSEATIKMREKLSKGYEKVSSLYKNLPECKFKEDLKPYVELSKALIEAINND